MVSQHMFASFLATAIVMLSKCTHQVAALQPVSVPLFQHYDRVLIGEDCHCDGTSVHCTGNTDEVLCNCDDGELSCIGDDCHCDGDTVHCTEESAEAQCSCTDGVVLCESSDETVEESESKPWGIVIGTSILVNLVTLAGVVVVAGEYLRKLVCPTWHADPETRVRWAHNYIPMFACGALLATVVFLILPEAYLLIAESLESEGDGTDDHAGHDHRFLEEDDHEGHSDETGASWRWGSSILCGFLIPVCINFAFSTPHKHGEGVELYMPSDKEKEVLTLSPKTVPEEVNASNRLENGNDTEIDEQPNINTDSKVTTETKTASESACFKPDINWSLFVSLSVGDFFHNFSDGVFIGTSFLLCEHTVAVTIVAATVAHELPQEIADFFLLVNQCHMSPIIALLMNFLVGMSVMFGGIIVLAIPDIGNGAIGVLLAIGGGVYLYVAICECYCRAERQQVTLTHKLGGFLGFALGAVPIGLVLLNHEHCGNHNH